MSETEKLIVEIRNLRLQVLNRLPTVRQQRRYALLQAAAVIESSAKTAVEAVMRAENLLAEIEKQGTRNS